MEIERILLTATILPLLYDVAILSKKKVEGGTLRISQYLASISCALVMGIYLMFVMYFVNSDFSKNVVYSYSSSSLPLLYKLSATWASMGGSLLLFIFLVSIVYLVYRIVTSSRNNIVDMKAYLFIDLILIFFVLLVVLVNPFEESPIPRFEGMGLNPLLQNFWMVIHPPIVFLGYALVFFLFAITLARMKTGGKEDSRIMKIFLSAAWLFITLGIALGGFWAYEDLSFGGYWSWDPVETASLIPWLTLTSYFHLSSISRKSLTKEFTIFLTFVLVIFEMFVTRSGILESVHAFGTSTIGPLLLLFIGVFAGYFLHVKTSIDKPLFSLKMEKSSIRSLSFTFGYLSLLGLTVVCTTGILLPSIVDLSSSEMINVDISYYNNWCFPFALGFLASLIGCSMPKKMNYRGFAIVILSTLLSGTIFAYFEWPTSNLLADLGLPLVIVALASTGYRLTKSLITHRSITAFSRNLIHLGIAMTLLGVFISSTMVQTANGVTLRPHEPTNILGTSMELIDSEVDMGSSWVEVQGEFFPEYAYSWADVSIKFSGTQHNKKLRLYIYSFHGYVIKPTILSTYIEDIYMIPQYTEMINQKFLQVIHGNSTKLEELTLHIRKVPLITAIWLGVALMAIGQTTILIKNLTKRNQKNQYKIIDVKRNS